MVDRARLLLNELMGINRDKIFDNEKNINFDNKDICKYNLLGFCPFTYFKNTKAGIKNCKYKIHDEYLKIAYKKLGFPNKEIYEKDMISFLEDILIDLEIKKEDLKIKSVCKYEIESDIESQVLGLESTLDDYLKEIESLYVMNKVDKAYEMVSQYEKLKIDLFKLKNNGIIIDESHVICNICGVLIELRDINRVEDKHKISKLHRGYKIIRNILGKLYKKNLKIYISDEKMEIYKNKRNGVINKK